MKTKTLPTDKEKMLKLYEEMKDCDTVRRFCEKLWPDEFKKKEEWKNITAEVLYNPAFNRIAGYVAIEIYHDGEYRGDITAPHFGLGRFSNYKIERQGNYFRILKRKD